MVEESLLNTEYILCACGCGQYRLKYTKTGYEGKYIKGHNDNKRKGTRLPEEHRKNIANAVKGSNNHMWKDNVKYRTLHEWINRNLPKPDLCQMCNKVSPHDAANITGVYNKDFKNWTYYCRRCHMISDGRRSKFLSYRKPFKRRLL